MTDGSAAPGVPGISGRSGFPETEDPRHPSPVPGTYSPGLRLPADSAEAPR